MLRRRVCRYDLHVKISESGSEGKDLVKGFEFSDDAEFVVKKIKRSSPARDIEGACKGMRLHRIKIPDQGNIRPEKLGYAKGRAALLKAVKADAERPVTLVFRLPWSKQIEDGEEYYWNEFTEESVYDVPEEVEIAQAAARQRQRAREEREEIKINPSSPWMGYTDEEGQIYYYREDTDDSVWEEPRQGIRGWAEG